MVEAMAAPHGPPEGDGDKDTPYFLDVEDPVERHGLGRLKVNPRIALNTLRMAMPVVLGMLTQTLVNILDKWMVGMLPSELANPGQAAIGFSLPLMWLVGGSLSAVWVGTQAITARRAGEGNEKLAGRALTNSLVLAISSSVCLTLLSIAAVPSIVGALYQDPASVELGVGYLNARLIGVVAMVVTFSYKSFFDGIGRTYLFMVAAIVMNLLNVLLNWLLIFGNDALGIAPMYVEGAAWASVISAYVGLAILVLASFMPALLRRYHYYHPTNLQWSVMREIVKLSVPNAGATLVVMVGFSAFYWVLGQVNDLIAEPGNPYIMTAGDVVVTINQLTFIPALAFGSATAAIVGQALGAGRIRLAEQYGWDAAKLWAYVMSCFGVVMFFFPDVLSGFINPDPLVIEAARNPLKLLATIQGVLAVAMVFAQTLYGTGEAKFVMFVELALHLGVMAPGAYLFGLVLEGGLLGAYVAPVIYGIALALATLLRFKQGKWKHIAI